MDSDVSDSSVVGYQGRLNACRSLADALALERAGEILTSSAPPEASLPDLMRLVDLLVDYQPYDDAEWLRGAERHTRALQFLASSQGYVRPRRARPLPC
jgi:hypothetical protein